MRTHTRITAITSIFLLLVIAASSFNWKPREATVQGPIYSGSLWRGIISEEYLSYRAPEGRLSYEKISTTREFIVGVDQTETMVVNSTTYTLRTTEGSTYYLVTSGHKPITDNRYRDIMNASTVYIQGNSFNYMAPDGRVLKMIEPIEVTVKPVKDLVEASNAIIIGAVGERYFNAYFSSPVLWKDDWEPGRMYTVEYVYRCEAMSDHSYRTVSLVFNSDRRLVDQRGVPDENSLQPFKISKQKAVEIARANGFPAEGDPEVKVGMYTNPEEWESLSDKLTPIYMDPQIAHRLVELSHYLWIVELVTPDPESCPRVHKYAVIDANTGELYQLGKFTVVAIG